MNRVEPRFVILKYMLKTPWMATCEPCMIKFLTPQELLGKPEEAEKRLREKFDLYNCKIRVER